MERAICEVSVKADDILVSIHAHELVSDSKEPPC